MKQLLCTLALAAVLAGCSADNDIPGGQPAPTDPSVIAPLGIASALICTDEQPATRATTSNLTSGTMGIFLANATGSTGYVAKENVSYTGTGGIWAATNPAQSLILGGENADVCAYYPFNAGKTVKTAIAMTTQSYTEAEVFYYDKNRVVNGTKEKRSTTFAMTHAYSQLVLNITRDANYPSTCAVSALSLNHTTMPKAGTLNITNGGYNITSAGNYPVPGTPFTLAANGTKILTLLVVPQPSAMTTDLIIAMTVDKQPMTTTIGRAQFAQFLAGKKYTINISVQGAAIKAVATTTDWEPSTVNNGVGYVPTPGADPLP